VAEPGEGFRVHEAEQLRRWRKLSPEERLDWLWQAKLFAERAARAAAARRAARPGEATELPEAEALNDRS
jgi:hypothetical protein